MTGKHRWVRGALVAAALAGLASPAAAQEYPVESGDLEVPGDDNGSMPAVEEGDSIRIAGGGFEPGGTVTLTIESDPVVLGTTQADAVGNIDATVTIPAGMPAGEHTLKASGPARGGGTLVLSQPVSVADDGETARGGTLAFTGSTTFRLVAVAAGLVTAGGALTIVTRRRRGAGAA